jgi:hypothetical protein
MPPAPRPLRFLKPIGWLLLFPLTLFCFGAITYDGPFRPPASIANLLLASAWLAALLTTLFLKPFRPRRPALLVALLLLVLIPWITIRPSNDRDWQPEFAETGWVDVQGDTLTFHNIRDFDYTKDGTATPRWESRTYQLSDLRGLDYFHNAFSDLLAHPILSFDFGEAGYLCLSIETRRENDESFSSLGGLFKMFELQYIFGTEQDFIRVRTNVRDERIFLYRSTATPEAARSLLLESVEAQNALKRKPRFYNIITLNCTTSLRAQRPAEYRAPFDIRMLLNGHFDEFLLESGALVDDDIPFAELRPLALINPAAKAAHDAPDFSAQIRIGRPGFPAGPSE